MLTRYEIDYGTENYSKLNFSCLETYGQGVSAGNRNGIAGSPVEGRKVFYSNDERKSFWVNYTGGTATSMGVHINADVCIPDDGLYYSDRLISPEPEQFVEEKYNGLGLPYMDVG